MSDIVPFGKYKGRPVEDLAADKQYTEWLANQEWFRERFARLYTMLAAATAPQETPVHNAMQAEFLNDKFCDEFFTFMTDNAFARNQDQYDRCAHFLQAEIEEWILVELQKRRSEKQEKYEKDLAHYEIDLAGFSQKHQVTLIDGEILFQKEHYRSRPKPPSNQDEETEKQYLIKPSFEHRFSKRVFDRKFEDEGADISLHFEGGHDIVLETRRTGFKPDFPMPHFIHKTYRIELKPAMGDDYPAVMRQVSASNCNVVMVGMYTGVGATWDQVKAIFASKGIRMLMRDELKVSVV